MGSVKLDLLTTLLDELNRRKKHNASYSLRAFAQSLGIPKSVLSDFLNKKSRLSQSSVRKIIAALKTDEVTSEKWLQKTTERTKKINDSSYTLINETDFQMISGWQHFAILCLADLKNNSADPEWISDRLNISVTEARDAMLRLQRLKLLVVEGKKLRGTSANIRTPTDIRSEAIRKLQLDHLELAKLALTKVPLKFRDLTSITLPLNIRCLEEAKINIKSFRRNFCRKYEDSGGDEIYTLAVQFFPLTKLKEME